MRKNITTSVFLIIALFVLAQVGFGQNASADAQKCKELKLYTGAKMIGSEALRLIVKDCDDALKIAPNDSNRRNNRGKVLYYLIRGGDGKSFSEMLSNAPTVSEGDLQKAMADLQTFVDDKTLRNSELDRTFAYLALGELTAVSAARSKKPELFQAALKQFDLAENEPGEWWEGKIAEDRSQIDVQLAMSYASSGSSFLDAGSDALKKRAKDSIAKGDNQSALSDLNDLLEVDKKNSDAYATRANAYINLKNYDKALADANKALELSPDFGWAFYLRGLVYLWQPKTDMRSAMADFTKVITLDPRLADEAYRFRSGIHNEYDKDYAAALSDASEAIKRNPNNGNSFAQRGWANTQLNNLPDAASDYRQAIKLNFATGGVYTTLSFIEFKLKDYPQAEAHARKALELEPNNQNAKDNLAGILAAKNSVQNTSTAENSSTSADAEKGNLLGMKFNSSMEYIVNYLSTYYHKGATDSVTRHLNCATLAIIGEKYNTAVAAYNELKGMIYKDNRTPYPQELEFLKLAEERLDDVSDGYDKGMLSNGCKKN